MTYKTIFCLIVGLSSIALACSMDAGAEMECPECDNLATLAVGEHCVPIEDVEVCGPDGHSHGQHCHCFSDQEPTEINGTNYCLQTECHSSEHEHEHDAHEHEHDVHEHDTEEHR